MNGHLGSLARFAQVDSVRQVNSLVLDDSWVDVHGSSPVVVQYDGVNSDIIRFSPEVDTTRTERARAALLLTEQEFLSVLVWLVRQGLLEHVGLVSTETAPPVGAGFKPARPEPAPVGATLSPAPHASPVQEDDGAGDDEEEGEIELDWADYFARQRAGGDGGRGQRLVTMVADEASADEEEGEPESEDPFHLPIFELEEGAGEPSWLEDAYMLRYLHHELELSVTDIARVCDTTYARVKVALKRLGIERRSYRGGRSKLAPRSESASTAP